MPASPNTLKINNAASDSLALGGNNLTLTGGGLMMTGSSSFSITGGSLTSSLLSATTTSKMSFNGTAYEAANPGSDLIIQQYGTGALNVSASITN